MAEQKTYGEESPAVQTHLSITQSVIQRMASNSSSCKAWCITLVSAILVIVADRGKAAYALIAFIPVVLFFALDAYYLALEKSFRESYNQFIAKLHLGQISSTDLYAVAPSDSGLKSLGGAVVSFSVWPFYGTLSVMIYVTKRLVIA